MGLPCGTSPGGSRPPTGSPWHPQRCGYGRTGSPGNGGHHSASAHLRPVHGGNRKIGFASYYVDHTAGIWPQAAGGIPFNACEFQSKGDPLTDLFEEPGGRAESPQHLRQHSPAGKRPGSGGSHPLPPGQGNRPLPAGSGKPSAACRISWTPKTSTPSIHPSMFRLPALLRQLMILLPSSPGLTLWGQPGSFIFRPVTPKRAESSSTP